MSKKYDKHLRRSCEWMCSHALIKWATCFVSKVTCVDKIAFGRNSLGSDVEAHLRSPQWTGATVQLGCWLCRHGFSWILSPEEGGFQDDMKQWKTMLVFVQMLIFWRVPPCRVKMIEPETCDPAHDFTSGYGLVRFHEYFRVRSSRNWFCCGYVG